MSTQTKLELSVADFIPVVRQLAEEMPDFRYVKPHGAVNCSNLFGGDSKYPDHPGCIIGQAARRLGVKIDHDQEDGDIGQLCRHYAIDRSDDNRFRWLEAVQTSQDGGCTWLLAVGVADVAFGQL